METVLYQDTHLKITLEDYTLRSSSPVFSGAEIACDKEAISPHLLASLMMKLVDFCKPLEGETISSALDSFLIDEEMQVIPSGKLLLNMLLAFRAIGKCLIDVDKERFIFLY